MSEAYVLSLARLECLQAQEFDGDEAYLTLNGVKIWEAAEHKNVMHHQPKDDRAVCEFNFEEGTRLTASGLQPIPNFESGRFVFADVSGDLVVALYDADRFSSDDLIGKNPISAHDAGRGHITVMFNRDGAMYRLTYVLNSQA
jgi:hypothetical protein